MITARHIYIDHEDSLMRLLYATRYIPLENLLQHIHCAIFSGTITSAASMLGSWGILHYQTLDHAAAALVTRTYVISLRWSGFLATSMKKTVRNRDMGLTVYQSPSHADGVRSVK